MKKFLFISLKRAMDLTIDISKQNVPTNNRNISGTRVENSTVISLKHPISSKMQNNTNGNKNKQAKKVNLRLSDCVLNLHNSAGFWLIYIKLNIVKYKKHNFFSETSILFIYLPILTTETKSNIIIGKNIHPLRMVSFK